MTWWALGVCCVHDIRSHIKRNISCWIETSFLHPHEHFIRANGCWASFACLQSFYSFSFSPSFLDGYQRFITHTGKLSWAFARLLSLTGLPSLSTITTTINIYISICIYVYITPPLTVFSHPSCSRKKTNVCRRQMTALGIRNSIWEFAGIQCGVFPRANLGHDN